MKAIFWIPFAGVAITFSSFEGMVSTADADAGGGASRRTTPASSWSSTDMKWLAIHRKM
jgi:hypothetical protein